MKQPMFVVYHARDGYRWRLFARNRRIIAESGEAYGTARAARRAVEMVQATIVGMQAVAPDPAQPSEPAVVRLATPDSRVPKALGS